MRTLTKTEAGARIGASEKTIQRLVHAGKLRGTLVGGRLKILEEDLNEYLRGGVVSAAASATSDGVHAA